MSRPAGPRPLTVLTGFLGSGKSTLLRSLLDAPGLEGSVVVVNEVGEVGLDHRLLRRVDEETVLLAGGCVCCASRQDLVETLLDLLDREAGGEIPPPTRVVLETSGLADPLPVVATLQRHPVLRHHFAVDHVVATVDATLAPVSPARRPAGGPGPSQPDRSEPGQSQPEWHRQLVAADLVVVTKEDLVDGVTRAALVAALRGVNPAAAVVERTRLAAALAEAASYPQGGEGRDGPVHAPGTSTAWLEWPGTVDWAPVAVWLSAAVAARGDELLRVKGWLDTGAGGPVVIDAAQHVVHRPRHLPGWGDVPRRSRVVVVARGISAQRAVDSLATFVGLAPGTGGGSGGGSGGGPARRRDGAG